MNSSFVPREDILERKRHSVELFSQIAARYDVANHVLSLGLDHRWRRELCRGVPDAQGLKVLDLASGTADILVALLKYCPQIESAVGMDLSEEMLAVARTKVVRFGLEAKTRMCQGDAAQTGLADNEFDVVTMAFGIRNMPDPRRVLSEMRRVLRPGGRVLILEFSFPDTTAVNAVSLFYVRRVLPFIGGMLTGQAGAYHYLKDTIMDFSRPEGFMAEMRETGFIKISGRKLFPGLVWLFQGEKTRA